VLKNDQSGYPRCHQTGGPSPCFASLLNELDVMMAKPLLMAMFASHPSVNHVFPLYVHMRLVPEINLIINTLGQKMLINYGHAKKCGIKPS